MHYVVSGILIVIVTFGWSAWGYEKTMLSEGGTLVGAVTLDGQVLKPKGYNLITLPDQVYCGRISNGQGWRLLQPFNVGPAGQFRGVVVSLEGIEKGNALTQTPTT